MDAFVQRVATREGLAKELRIVNVKVSLGLLEKPEDSYMWPYIDAASKALDDPAGKA